MCLHNILQMTMMRKEFDIEWLILSNAFIFEIMNSMTGKHPKKQEVNQKEIHTV